MTITNDDDAAPRQLCAANTASNAELSCVNTSTDTQRLQLEFTPAYVARLREMQRRSGARSNSEAVRFALQLFEWFLLQREDGWQLQLVRDDVVREVEVIFR